MRTRRRAKWLLSATLVAVTGMVTGAMPHPARAEQVGDATTAVSSGGLVAIGGFSTPGGDVFEATLVIPDGVTSESPHGSGVDFAETWGSLTKTNGGPPAVGSAYPCSVVTNPTSWSDGFEVQSPDVNNTSHEPRSGIYFDAACDDDSGFEFYRVRWDDKINPFTGKPQGVFDTRARLPLWHSWGRAVQQTSGHTGAVFFRSEASESADVSVCGFDGHRFQCLESRGSGGGGGSVYFSSFISVIAG